MLCYSGETHRDYTTELPILRGRGKPHKPTRILCQWRQSVQQFLSMPTQQQWSVALSRNTVSTVFCNQNPMENQAGEMLPMTPAEAAGNWRTLLPLWKHPQSPSAEGHHCIVARWVMFSLAAALIAKRGGHLGMSQQPHPLPFFPPLPPAMPCNAWM